jgi:hypothetical protein
MIEFLQMILNNPGSSAVVVISSIAFAFYVGMTYRNIRYMQANMVTKETLRAELAEFRNNFYDDMNKDFVRKPNSATVDRR